MNKKSLIGLFLCVLLLFAAAGCSKTNTSTTAGNASTQTADQQNSASQATGNATQSSSNGQSTPDLFGQVKSVTGSTITLALAKMPQQGNTPPQNPPAAQGQSTNQAAPKNMSSPELTGETKTITIPDGVKITTGNKDNSKEVSVSNIKAGDMMEVTLKDGAVSQVRLMQAPPQQ
ncbi:MAG TPA: hypothetical protein VN426_13065 [Syntrophomonadaceae bacterium]|nr:hypothetical protein [Syntrophomonadaceae bacterium]